MFAAAIVHRSHPAPVEPPPQVLVYGTPRLSGSSVAEKARIRVRYREQMVIAHLICEPASQTRKRLYVASAAAERADVAAGRAIASAAMAITTMTTFTLPPITILISGPDSLIAAGGQRL